MNWTWLLIIAHLAGIYLWGDLKLLPGSTLLFFANVICTIICWSGSLFVMAAVFAVYALFNGLVMVYALACLVEDARQERRRTRL